MPACTSPRWQRRWRRTSRPSAMVGMCSHLVNCRWWTVYYPFFFAIPMVINGASQLLQTAFGDAGQHARSAVGVAVLPLDAPVEVEILVAIRS